MKTVSAWLVLALVFLAELVALAGLWWTGHRGSALAVGALVVVVHALAALPAVRAVRADGV